MVIFSETVLPRIWGGVPLSDRCRFRGFFWILTRFSAWFPIIKIRDAIPTLPGI